MLGPGRAVLDVIRGASVATIGLDLAKHVFQVHAIDAAGRVVISRALRRKDVLAFFERLPLCLIGMEACGSAHHWARQLMKLGHDVRLMPPAYVKAYVRRQKNDAADAAAICEAATRPSMRFAPVRSVKNQAALMHHKVRELLVARRTQLLNALRSHLAEIGIIAAQGPNNARGLAVLIAEGNDMIPAIVRSALLPVVRRLKKLDQEITKSDQAILTLAKANETARRLMSVPGVGPITASALAASIQDISAFSGPREFAAFLGLTPRQSSSGGGARFQDGQPISAQAARRRRSRGPLPSQTLQRCVETLGRSPDGDQAVQARRRGDRQQACPHRLRAHAPRNSLRGHTGVTVAAETAHRNRG